MKENIKYRIAVRGVIEKDGFFLLLERAKPARNQSGFWELPGGGLEFGESPQEALVREVFEETGLIVSVEKPLCVWRHMRGKDTQIIGITFRCNTKNNTITLSKEHLSYAWLDLLEIKHKKVFPELLKELEEMDL